MWTILKDRFLTNVWYICWNPRPFSHGPMEYLFSQDQVVNNSVGRNASQHDSRKRFFLLREYEVERV